jgi:precorrin-4/cobalt-precorrin-4 C11-methyltransferase
VVIAYRATWPDELYIRTTLAGMREEVREAKITRTALIFVGKVFGENKFRDSDLYNSEFSHVLRNVGKKKKAKVV